jgi:hypothetical protein
VRKYKLISRKQVALAIEKEDQMSKLRFLKQLRRRLPVKFEDFASQGLILKRLFSLLNKRKDLQLNWEQFG